MTTTDVFSIAGALLASLGGGAAIVFGLSNWLGRVWANRLMQGDKARYARELEGLKAEFTRVSEGDKARYARELEGLKAEFTRVMEGDKARYARELEGLKAEFTWVSEDRTRKLKGLMRHFERQIEEFYGPLFNLVNQILFEAFNIATALVKEVDGQNAEVIREYFRSNYFYPIHEQIYTILKTKLYLIEGAIIPETFTQYLRHSMQERVQTTLWKEHGVGTSLPNPGWPWDFYRDIKSGFDTAKMNYQQCLDGLKTQGHRVTFS